MADDTLGNTIAATFFVLDLDDVGPEKRRLYGVLSDMADRLGSEIWRVDWRVDEPHADCDGMRRILGRAWLSQPSGGWMGYDDPTHDERVRAAHAAAPLPEIHGEASDG